jgi:hypothetical protein
MNGFILFLIVTSRVHKNQSRDRKFLRIAIQKKKEFIRITVDLYNSTECLQNNHLCDSLINLSYW